MGKWVDGGATDQEKNTGGGRGEDFGTVMFVLKFEMPIASQPLG